MDGIGVRTGGRGDSWLGRGVAGDCGGGALGRLGLPEVGLKGRGGTKEEGVGRSTGGATRRDR